MTFNPDGRTLLCGLHESLKVFSWEPIRCHDGVDVGWSRLSDLNIHEGKLLGCSYNQSCVGVWVVDISRIEPYAIGNTPRSNGLPEPKSNSSGSISVLTENTAKASLGRLSVSQNSDPVMKETKSLGKLSASQNSDPINKESKSFTSTGTTPVTPQRVNSDVGSKTTTVSSLAIPAATAPRRNTAKIHSTANASSFNSSDVVPVIVPRNNARLEQAAELRREGLSGRMMSLSLQSKASDFRKFSNTKDDMERPSISGQSETEVLKATEFSGAEGNIFPAVKTTCAGNPAVERNIKYDRSTNPAKRQMNLMTESSTSYLHESYETRAHNVDRDACSVEGQGGGRTRSLVASWEKKDRYADHQGLASSNLSTAVSAVDTLPTNGEMLPASEEDTISDLMKQHDQFVGTLQSRLAKLQIVHKYWERNDIKGAISVMEKMTDHAVLADIVSILTEKTDIVTLDICTCLLPLLSGLLESEMDRYQGVSLEMLLKLVRVFGSVIYSSLSASSSVGVDIEAEQRLERCNLCYVELEKVKRLLLALTRRGGSIAKSAQELSLALQEIS